MRTLLLLAAAAAALVPVAHAGPVHDVGWYEGGPSRYCADTSGASLVVREACEQIPRLRDDPNLSAYDATTLLREWAATWIDIAASTDTLLEPTFWQHDVDTLRRRFEANERGGFCGNTAWVLMKLYRAFGFNSWVYAYGVVDEAWVTHAVTLVRVDDGVVVQDAYANYSLTDERGEPLDVRELLRRLRAGRLNGVRRDEPARASARTVLFSTEAYAAAVDRRHWLGNGAGGDPHGCIPAGEALACQVPRVDFNRLGHWLSGTVTPMYPGFVAAMRGASAVEKLMYLTLRPLYLTSDTDGYTAVGDTSGTVSGGLLAELADAAGG